MFTVDVEQQHNNNNESYIEGKSEYVKRKTIVILVQTHAGPRSAIDRTPDS